MDVASRRLTIAITTLWLLLNAWSATAETSEQIWVDYNPLWQGAGQVELFGDVGYRTEIDNNDVWRLVLRPSVAVPAGNFRLTAGIGNFLTFFDKIDDRWELRPFQGVSTVWPEGRFSMEHYVRLEERFDFNTENWNSVNSLRLRYQLLTTWLLPSMQDDRRWSLVGIIEPFLKLAGNEGTQREQFRLTAGIERDIGNEGSVRLEFSWQQEEIFFNSSETIDEFFFRLRIFH